jgi:hypothetical protein
MRVIDFERDELFGLAVDDGSGEFYIWLRFEADGEDSTKVSATADFPSMPDSADASRLIGVAERWLHNTENLI